MSLEAFPLNGSEPGAFLSFVKFVGGTTAVTRVYGTGVTVTYISSGIVDLTWSDSQGTFVDVVGALFQATTPGDVKAYELVPGVYNTTTNTLRLNMYETGTLTDLAALEWLSITLLFKRTSV
jgi:hypothetical protein